MRRNGQPEGEDARYISYADVYEWQEDFNSSHGCISNWAISIRRLRRTDNVVMEVYHLARRKDGSGSYYLVKQTVKQFGRNTDHATLPGAMIAALVEADRYLTEVEGSGAEDDTDPAPVHPW